MHTVSRGVLWREYKCLLEQSITLLIFDLDADLKSEAHFYGLHFYVYL